MPVRIGKIELTGLTDIYTEDTRNLVQQRAPGQAGAVFQDLGREPVTVVMEGVLVGQDTLVGVEKLRQAQTQAKPLSFAADAVAGADLTQVLIADLQVKQLAGYAGRYSFFLRVQEYVEPPAPARAGSSAVNRKATAAAAKWNKDALGAANVLKNPKSLMGAVSKNPSLLKSLKAGDLGGMLDKARSAFSGRDFGTLLGALAKVDPMKIVGVVDSLRKSGSLGEFMQKLAAEGLPLVEQMSGLNLGKAATVVRGIAGAGDFLSKLQQVLKDARALVDALRSADPLAPFRDLTSSQPGEASGFADVLKGIGALMGSLEAVLASATFEALLVVVKEMQLSGPVKQAMDALRTALSTLETWLSTLLQMLGVPRFLEWVVSPVLELGQGIGASGAELEEAGFGVLAPVADATALAARGLESAQRAVQKMLQELLPEEALRLLRGRTQQLQASLAKYSGSLAS